MNENASELRYSELQELLSDPTVFGDPSRVARLSRELARLEPLVLEIRRLREVESAIEETKSLLTESDEEAFRELAREELAELVSEAEALEASIADRLSPRDENDERSVIVEIRAGAGGEEAALFAATLFRLYSAYALRHGWTSELLDANETEIGGFKSVVFAIEGEGAYSRFKFESGVHRVQRVPVTESGGRIHTSTVTVAVLPEAEEVDVWINPADLEIDTFRASGAGGQHVNKTSSAIRITHRPTGIVVTCQDERSQHKNRERALTHLRSILLEREREAKEQGIADQRRSQVGTGDRSERIRTYNYPQGRVTDHRINLTLYRLEEILGGDLDELTSALQRADHDRSVAAATS